MKQKRVSAADATLEVSKDELGIIIYLYETNATKLNKKERTFIQEIQETIKKMNELEEIEESIKGIFRK